MHSHSLPDSWNLDQILDDLNAHGFAIIDHAYSDHIALRLQMNVATHMDEFREAGIQNGVVSNIGVTIFYGLMISFRLPNNILKR